MSDRMVTNELSLLFSDVNIAVFFIYGFVTATIHYRHGGYNQAPSRMLDLIFATRITREEAPYTPGKIHKLQSSPKHRRTAGATGTHNSKTSKGNGFEHIHQGKQE